MEKVKIVKGYAGKSISRRALNAYRKGLMPLSQINAAVLKEYSIPFQVGFFKWLVNNQYIVRSEWHHTGPNRQETDFFAMADVVEQFRELDVFALFSEYEMEKKKASKGYFVRARIVSEDENSPRMMGFVKGSRIYFVDHASTRVTSKNVEIIQRFTSKPKRMKDEDANLLLHKAKVKLSVFSDYDVRIVEVAIKDIIKEKEVAPPTVKAVVSATLTKEECYYKEKFYWVSQKSDPAKIPVPALLIGNFAYTKTGGTFNIGEIRLHGTFHWAEKDKGWMTHCKSKSKTHKPNVLYGSL